MRAKKLMQQTGPQVQLAVLSYMSDAYFIGAAVQVYDVPGQTFETKMAMAASLNHTIYFHHPDAVRADEWMCSERESPWAGNDRALVIQRIWSPEGILVATCVQEVLKTSTFSSPPNCRRLLGLVTFRILTRLCQGSSACSGAL